MTKGIIQKKKVQKKVRTYKFTIDCQNTVEDNVLSLDAFTKYMRENIKHEGKKNNLSDKVTVSSEGYNIVVTSKGKFAKRYLKYLAKKYLKKNELRDYIRVIASSKNAYQLKYFNVNQGDEEEAE